MKQTYQPSHTHAIYKKNEFRVWILSHLWHSTFGDRSAARKGGVMSGSQQNLTVHALYVKNLPSPSQDGATVARWRLRQNNPFLHDKIAKNRAALKVKSPLLELLTSLQELWAKYCTSKATHASRKKKCTSLSFPFAVSQQRARCQTCKIRLRPLVRIIKITEALTVLEN